MNQAIGILDAYLYRSLVWDIYVERVSAPRQGGVSDEAKIAKALPQAAMALTVLDEFLGAGDWLAGPHLSLADLHAAPMELVEQVAEAKMRFAIYNTIPEGSAMNICILRTTIITVQP
ncbi:glutathione S-transferase domain-containing protein, partial [bacterium]|nr:glutathione S-transferase domain-containing protein [bacterium]